MERLHFRDCLRISLITLLVTNIYVVVKRNLSRKNVTIVINDFNDHDTEEKSLDKEAQ